MVTPTRRTIAHLKAQGYTCAVVEKWNSHARIRQDLFGFIDVLAIRDGETLAVQSTSGSNGASRVKKITDHENLPAVRKAGWRVVVHAWRKLKTGWAVRETDLS